MSESEFVMKFEEDHDLKNKNRSCIYCGDISQEIHRDHVIPCSWKGYGRNYAKGDTVICCKECNQALSDNLMLNIPARANFLYSKFYTKWDRKIKFKTWSDEELCDMSDKFVKAIKESEAQKKYYKERLAHLAAVASEYLEVEDEVKQQTIDEQMAYRVIVGYVNMKGKKDDVIESIASGLKINKSFVIGVINERDEFRKIIAQFKFERFIPLDVTINQLRRMK